MGAITDKNTPEWYLNVAGHQTGPFSFDQIEGLLHDGEILPSHEVRQGDHGEWKLLEAILSDSLVSSVNESPVQKPVSLPARPETFEDSDSERDLQPEDTRPNYPVRALFDAILSQKEKTAAKLIPPTQSEHKEPFEQVLLRFLSNHRKKLLFATFVTIGSVLAVVTWQFNKPRAPISNNPELRDAFVASPKSQKSKTETKAQVTPPRPRRVPTPPPPQQPREVPREVRDDEREPPSHVVDWDKRDEPEEEKRYEWEEERVEEPDPGTGIITQMAEDQGVRLDDRETDPYADEKDSKTREFDE